MWPLTDWLGVVDGHAPGDACRSVGVGHEARIETAAHGFAGILEGALRDGVVDLHEVEFDGIANGRLDVLGLVTQHGRGLAGGVCRGLRAANHDGVGGSEGAARGEEWEESRRLHYCGVGLSDGNGRTGNSENRAAVGIKCVCLGLKRERLDSEKAQ